MRGRRGRGREREGGEEKGGGEEVVIGVCKRTARRKVERD